MRKNKKLGLLLDGYPDIYVIKEKEKKTRGIKDLAWSKFYSTDVLWTKNRSLS